MSKGGSNALRASGHFSTCLCIKSCHCYRSSLIHHFAILVILSLFAFSNFFSFPQVSHHPPISAFYAEHVNQRIALDGHLWTKSKFLGLSIAVEMVGSAVISLLKLDEEYVVTFPCGYGR